MDTNATTSTHGLAAHGLAAHRPAVSAKPPRSAHLLPSVFHDLPGPELYDPSWYSNKLRAECGRLDTRHPTATSTSTATATAASPVLPKSYHVRPDDHADDDSDDTDEEDDDDGDEDDEDDDSEAPTTLLSSDVPLTNATLDSDLDVHMRTPSSPTKHRSSLQPDDLLNKPRIINNDEDDPDHDFPASVKNHSIDILPSPVSVAHHHHHLQHATSGRLASYMQSPSQPQSTHRFSPTVSVTDATSSTPRKGLRFSRRSMFGFNIDSPSPSSSAQSTSQRQQNIYPQYQQHHHRQQQQHQQYHQHQQIAPQQQTQQQDGAAAMSGQVNKRHSRMFRASRLFGHGGGSSNVERHQTTAPAAEETQYRDDYPKQSLSRSLLRRSVVGASKVASTGAVVGSSATHFITSGFGRRSVVFHWPIAPLETLYKLRILLENRFAAIATGLKTDELRMQVPLHQPSYTPLPTNNQDNGGKAATACAVVIAVDENRDGSRVLLRRSLRDTFHGGSDEFEWLCTQITEQLRQFHPGIRMFYP